jgi:hypothetical protein
LGSLPVDAARGRSQVYQQSMLGQQLKQVSAYDPCRHAGDDDIGTRKHLVQIAQLMRFGARGVCRCTLDRVACGYMYVCTQPPQCLRHK